MLVHMVTTVVDRGSQMETLLELLSSVKALNDAPVAVVFVDPLKDPPKDRGK